MQQKVFLNLLIVLLIQKVSCSLFRIKKVECKTFDPEVVTIDLCDLGADIKHPALSVSLHLVKTPITKANFRIIVGLVTDKVPVIVLNNSWDACAFMKKRKSNRVLGRLYQTIAPYTNINHTCPYDVSCGQFRIKKLECKTFDPEVMTIDLCDLGAERKPPALSIALHMVKAPITKVNIRIIVGLVTDKVPVIVLNNSWDGCAFMKKRKTNRVFGRLYQYVAPYTNMNHTCPYNICCTFMLKSIECQTFDQDFVKFDLCELGPNSQNISAISVVIRLFKLPLKSFNLRITMSVIGSKTPMKILNNTWNACNFLKNRKSNNLLGRLYQYIAPFTNLNHSCPINHDIHIKNLTLIRGQSFLAVFTGEYLITLEATVKGKKRIKIQIISGY
ncbi:uncharacterized protein LOC106084708 isoform X1 [Stomoxys calcitrans]|uniref:uncharacterized protein LOC106084708 isoform X1 n=1 Tax=Stomoxys calcitrans TaxID=35570 RepID=UPI0027E3A350|nr:uncharacterized protein LOC106084708 isoform X1 [Stomoxys calcitrans]